MMSPSTLPHSERVASALLSIRPDGAKGKNWGDGGRKPSGCQVLDFDHSLVDIVSSTSRPMRRLFHRAALDQRSLIATHRSHGHGGPRPAMTVGATHGSSSIDSWVHQLISLTIP